MTNFFTQWHTAAITSTGFFWMALWAFALGYLISSLIQVLVTRRRMRRAMGSTGPRSIALASFFGLISSSCSFAALATTRALFAKGAGLAPSIAFLLASTNLVIELGIVIALFLGWQFVVGEYVGGVLLILFAWLFIRVTNPKGLIGQARDRAGRDSDDEDGDAPGWRERIRSLAGWRMIGQTYVMEWQMVWKDVLIGFTVAGIIAAFVPAAFFEALFVGSGGPDAANPGLSSVLLQTLVGPIAAFFTFIGSMGNIPLAALLYEHGVSFAGVMAFIFSDLVVLPVLRINATYYGWPMALYILALLLSGLVVVSLLMHYGLAALELLPHGAGRLPGERDFFAFGAGFVLNLVFLALTAVLAWLARSTDGPGHDETHEHNHDHGGSSSLSDRILAAIATLALLWLAGGLLAAPLLT